MPTLKWLGKDKIINHANQIPFHVLNHKYNFQAKINSLFENEININTGNKIIHGDNLIALKSLLPEYAGKIKCVYIDPPYNTGNENWVYNDNVSDPKFEKWLGEVVGKEGEDFTRHDKWLCMMYPRLKLLKDLLSDDGAIFISIDDNEQANLKLLCDEIFGANNFVANISVVSNLKGRSAEKYIATAHEYLMIYKMQNFITNGVPVPEEYVKKYKLEDDVGKYRLLGLRKSGSNSKREDRPNLFYPFYYDEVNNILSVDELPNAVKILPYQITGMTEGRWRWSKETAREKISELVAQKVKGRGEYDVFQKNYLPEKRRVKPKSVWFGAEFSAGVGTLEVKEILGQGVFNTPKPVGIIEYVLQQATDPDSVILDSFAGSGTTAHAVLNLNKLDNGNRKFILIELEDYAESITAERVKRVMQGYNNIEGTGGSFDFYEVGEPIMINGELNKNLDIKDIYKYIWHAETGEIKDNFELSNNKYYLGEHDNIAIYFYYEPDNITCLNYEFLEQHIKHKSAGYIIYACTCTLGGEFMSKNNIEFKKIPRDIKKILE